MNRIKIWSGDNLSDLEQNDDGAQGQDSAPFTDLALKPQERERYLELLLAFYEAQDKNHGAEADVDASLDALALVDAFAKSIAKERGIKATEGIEALFNVQAADSPLSIGDHLNSIEKKLLNGLKAAQNSDGRLGVIELLQKGGAQIVETKASLVRTDSSRASIEAGNGGISDLNTPANKFSQVIDLILHPEMRIGGARIYTDDLVVLLGEVDPKKVRNRPYDVIQIPKIGKEIAVCDLMGQAMFVSSELHGPKIYEAMNKEELEHVFGMARVEYRGDWQSRMIGALSDDAPEHVQKMDVADFAKKQKSAKMRLSPEIVGLALLKYAAEYEGRMAHGVTEDAVPDLPRESWAALNSAGLSGYRKIQKGMDIPAVKRLYGWYDSRNNILQDKIDKDIEHFKATGEMLRPVISEGKAIQKPEKTDLSSEIVALALLKYAAAHGGKMASETTTDPVPDMVGERWRTISFAGRTGGRGLPEGMALVVVRRICGWQDKAKTMPKSSGTFKAQLDEDIAYFEEHGEMSDDLKLRIDQGVAAHVASFEAKHESRESIPEYGSPEI